MLNGEAVSIGHWQISHKHGVYGFFIRHFTTETRRKLDRVNFRKDFWDCYQGKGKNWPIAERRVTRNDPRNNCRTLFGFSSLIVARVANSSAVDCSKPTSCFVDYEQSLRMVTRATKARARKSSEASESRGEANSLSPVPPSLDSTD